MDEDLVTVAKKRGMGQVAKVADPCPGKFLSLLEPRGREGGQTPGKIRQAVISESVAGAQLLEFREIHMCGEIQLAGISQRILNPLVVSDRHKSPGGSCRGKKLSGRETIIQS